MGTTSAIFPKRQVLECIESPKIRSEMGGVIRAPGKKGSSSHPSEKEVLVHSITKIPLGIMTYLLYVDLFVTFHCFM
jgi:hypothetical protein